MNLTSKVEKNIFINVHVSIKTFKKYLDSSRIILYPGILKLFKRSFLKCYFTFIFCDIDNF